MLILCLYTSSCSSDHLAPLCQILVWKWLLKNYCKLTIDFTDILTSLLHIILLKLSFKRQSCLFHIPINWLYWTLFMWKLPRKRLILLELYTCSRHKNCRVSAFKAISASFMGVCVNISLQKLSKPGNQMFWLKDR